MTTEHSSGRTTLAGQERDGNGTGATAQAAEGVSRPFRFGATSLGSGAFQLMPVPFLDDWLTTRLRERLVRSVLLESGIAFDRDVPRIAARWDRGSLVHRFRRCTVGLGVKLLRKAFRTAFVWLALRRAVRSAIDTYFLGRFWSHPNLRTAFSSVCLDQATALELSSVFERLADGIDARLTGDAVRRIWRVSRSRVDDLRGRVALDDVADALEQEQPGFLAEFDRRVAEHLRRRSDAQC